MIYNNFNGKNISALGMGCMRLPCIDKEIDKSAAKALVAYAMENGINYFDTAWGYHGGMSEPVMGELLSEYPRESFYLATKFPGYDVSNMPNVRGIFEKQLERCRTDYFDFYLFHNVCERNIDYYLNEEYGIHAYLVEQKKKGIIRHLGFSAHGSRHTIKRFLDAYGKDLEFCQLQVNWLDYDFQNAKAKIELVHSYNIPVFVMEPVRGGKLINLEEKYLQKLKMIDKNLKPAEWAFRFLQGIDGVTLTLSGMSDLDQLRENIAIYSKRDPLGDTQREGLLSLAQEMIANTALPCTSCRYCVDHCPNQLDIPFLLGKYNEYKHAKDCSFTPESISSLEKDKDPTSCVGCASCEKVCPQGIRISDAIAELKALC